MNKAIISSVFLLQLSACVAAPYPGPNPGYYGGAVYEPQYGYYGAYPAHRDFHRQYNYGGWHGAARPEGTHEEHAHESHAPAHNGGFHDHH